MYSRDFIRCTVRWQGTWKLVHGCGESCRPEPKAATWLYNEFNILQSFTISKRVKRIFPVIIISQIEYADKIKIPVWVPQFNENWRHLKLTSLKRAVWCINVQSGDRSTPPFWMLCCTCSDVYGAFKRETCFTWFLPGFFDIYVPGKLTNQITRNFFAV